MIRLALIAAVCIAGCVERAPVLATRDAAAPPDIGPRDFGTRDAAVPVISGRSTVAAATSHSCAIGADGLYCWGSDLQGRLGNGPAAGDSDTPTRVESDAAFVGVVAYDDHTCALDASGALWCWGANGDGQLGLGDRDPRQVPTEVPLSGPVRELGVGQAHTCVILLSGELWCWGRNTEGQLGVEPPGDWQASDVPLRVGDANDWTRVSGGQGHTLGLRGSELWGWGRNSDFQLGLGLGAPIQRRSPTAQGSDGWIEVAGGQNHSCALREDGAVWCWGDNNSFQLGTGDLTAQPEPIAIDPGPWEQVAADTFHSCVQASGTLACWGRNAEGQLGTGDIRDRTTPTILAPSPRGEWSEVATGRFHTCARDVLGDVYCTGANSSLQLGTGDGDRRRELTLVLRVSPG